MVGVAYILNEKQKKTAYNFSVSLLIILFLLY
jgi:hypothetical protein